MLYNLRSDIIYYKTNSDFEMEFNLCGCCRMRLLTDKASNKKVFVHSLARAVSRSRVILIAGPLFGEENTVEIVAKALGTETEITNNSAYNIKSEDEIEIIKGSLPLVSADGSYGGCIIESGPQTMILLTDNKTLRKSIMTSLIHPYISDLYEAEGKSNQAAPENVTVVPEAEEAPAVEEIPIVEETPADEEAADEEAVGLIDSTDESLNEEADTPEEQTDGLQDEKIQLIFESIPDDEPIVVTDTDIGEKSDAKNLIFDTDDKENYVLTPEEISVANQLIFDSDNNLYVTEKPNDAHQKAFKSLVFDDGGEAVTGKNNKHTAAFNIATIIVTAILLLTIIVLCYCIFAVAGKEGISPAEYIKTVWQTVFG